MLEATEGGSGFRIAQRDLEIRGAGNILGVNKAVILQVLDLTCIQKCLASCRRIEN
ncbi:MAG: hypothetical protein CM1200mP38_7150 [Dehalococcoidia bacterium]|nr:MAG: hypothetical protein CM1200mP38_7150 [Dehalococcoidia bacterium]